MALPLPLSPGEQVYKFTLRNPIGGGSFGEVWLAHDQTIKNDVAVKFQDASRVQVDKLLKEAVVGHRTGHANLATVHYADVISHNGVPLVAVAMDYYPNGNALSQVCPGNFVPIKVAVSQIIDILRGLEYLHELDTLHNDIKPQNILVGPNGEGILTDYGISERTSGGASTKPGASYKLHKAPEVFLKNEIDPLTDVYQVGITLFRLINGLGLIRAKRDTLGETEFRRRVLEGKLIMPSDYQPFVPGALRRVITKAINPDPAQRFQSALQFRRALERLSLSGSWSVDATGEYVGEDKACTYRAALESNKSGSIDFTVWKKYKKSGREVKAAKHGATGLAKKAAERLRQTFMCSVVEGRI